MLVSSETGVRWRLASSALVQHAKLQRHFLGACVKRGNRGECCALLLGDSSAVCCLSSPTPACTPALHFLASGDINAYTLNMYAHSLMFMFLSWGHDGTQQAMLPEIHSSRRKATIFPKSLSAASCKNTFTCCVFQMAFVASICLHECAGCGMRHIHSCRVTVGGWDRTLNLATVWKSRKRGFLCFIMNLPTPGASPRCPW